MTSSARESLAWAAGFFDGEGSLWYKAPVRSGARSHRGGRGQVRISIQQCDPESLERFKAAVGGLGRVVGPYTRKQVEGRQASPFWTYEAHRWRDAQAVVALLWLFLGSVKRAQIAAVLSRFRNHDLLGA